MADIGDVYYCTWETNERGECVGWEKRRPSLRASAATAEELPAALGNVIGEHYSDFEAALHFDPPLASAREYEELFADNFVEIGWNSTFGFQPSADTAFAFGRCERCKWGKGPRTSTPLIVNDIDDGCDGAFSPSTMPGHLMIVSESFVQQLTDEEWATFDTRPVEWSTKRQPKFFEIIPKAIAQDVAIRGVDVSGWRCDRCGQKLFSHSGVLAASKVVCRSDLLPPTPPLLFVGNGTRFHVYTTRARWDSLCGKPGSRKLWSERLAVVEESQCEREPWLPTLDELAAFRREHGFKVPYKRPEPER